MIKTKFLMQYDKFKAKYPEHIVLIQKGNFYIALYEDAELLSEICGFKIKEFTNNNISRCGFPVSSLEKNIKNINDKGHIIVVCDEKDEYDEKLGIKKREVTQIQNVNEKTAKTQKKLNDKKPELNYSKLISEKISELDIDNTSPIDALNFLHELKRCFKYKEVENEI